MISNEGVGPYVTETYPGGLELGDVIQLGNEKGLYYHTLIVTGFRGDGYLIASHSEDSFDRPLSTYTYYQARFLHIEGIRLEIPDMYLPNCFDSFIAGESL